MSILLLVALAFKADSPFPARPADAPVGSVVAKEVENLPLKDREERLVAEVLRGNVPTRSRTFRPVVIRRDGRELTIEAAEDHLAVGTDADGFRTPLSPLAAQRIADRLDCVLPTPRMVDEIDRAATIRLAPSPIPPSPAMTTVPVFLAHDALVREQLKNFPASGIVSGLKKDVVVSARLADRPGKVAIYGWRRLDGRPIQPLYLGHTAAWVDYSHGIRLVRRAATLDGRPTTVDAVLKDKGLAPLLSDEGPLDPPRFVLAELPPEPPRWAKETTEELRLDPDVRVRLNRAEPKAGKPTLLVFYALPNGNTIEWTAGRRLRPGDDWRFDIQHIDAQTRFLRERSPDRNIVVAYLENDLKSWPAWRRKHGNARIPEILAAVRAKFDPAATRVALNGHSGGGSLIFGYLESVDAIPPEVERIAFLDSNYAYESDRHRAKLFSWLQGGPSRFLCVLAYEDHVALLNGKTFVSEKGGTWGRSKAMRADLAESFPLVETRSGEMSRLEGLGGRIEFYLRSNPEKKILHTVQVERNGFVESMLSGTPLRGAGYEYFGDRAYGRFVAESP